MKIEDLDQLPTIHYTQMPPHPADSPVYQEVQTFRRELPRLLAEGHEGKWALIQGDEIIGLYPTFDEAYRAGLERFLRQRFILQPVREWQPLLRSRVCF
jgi:hypothetical protein